MIPHRLRLPSLPRRGRLLRFICAPLKPLALWLLLLLQVHAAEPSPMPPGLTEAAQAALKKFLPSLDSAAMKQEHGFAPGDDFKELTLGEPFEPFFLQSAGIKKYAGGKVADSLVPSGSWYFPVRSRDRLACLVSVMKLPEGKLVEERLGMPEVARAWAAITEAWPASKGQKPLFIIVPSQQRFYFTVPQVEPPNLTPIAIESKDAALPKTYERLTPASEAFARLRG